MKSLVDYLDEYFDAENFDDEVQSMLGIFNIIRTNFDERLSIVDISLLHFADKEQSEKKLNNFKAAMIGYLY